MNVLLRLALVFAAMVFLIRRRVPVGYVLAGGALLLCLLSGLGPRRIALAFWQGAVGPSSLGLLAAVVLVTLFGEVLRRVENLSSLVEALGGMLGDKRMVMGAAPAVIGLLPMPGGAMLSAPLVRQAADGLDVPADQLTVVNYWFRHIWEYCWPLYPGIIAASVILSAPLGRLALVHLPMSVAAFGVGALWVMRGVSAQRGERHGGGGGALVRALAPVSSVIAAAMLLKAAGLRDPWNLVAALGVGVPVCAYAFGMDAGAFGGALREALRPSLVVLVLGLMIFKRSIEVSGAAAEIPGALARLGVPGVLVVGLLSFICGLLTGITLGYVSVAYPILAPMILSGGGVDYGLAMLAFGAGYVGVLLSPVHLCLVLSREYFGADLGLVYRRLVVPCAAVVATFVVLPMLGWGG